MAREPRPRGARTPRSTGPEEIQETTAPTGTTPPPGGGTGGSPRDRAIDALLRLATELPQASRLRASRRAGLRGGWRHSWR